MGKLSHVLKALDMTKAARMKRAAEQGFDTSKTFYHGTSADITEFDPLKMGRTDDGWFGKGFYFSPKTGVANQYANDGAANVVPVNLRVKNPYDWRKNEGRGMRLGTQEERYNKTREIIDAGYDAVDVYQDTIKGDGLTDAQWYAYVQTTNGRGDATLPRDMVEKSIRAGVSRDDFVRYYGEDLAAQMPVERELVERVVFDPSNIRSTNAAFDPENIGKSDLLGAVDTRLLAPLAGAGAAGDAAVGEFSEAESAIDDELVSRVAQDFAQRRAAKNDYWQKIKGVGETALTLGSGIAGGVVGDLSRIGGYLNPFMPVEDTERGSEAINSYLQYQPSQAADPYLNAISRPLETFQEDIERGIDQIPQGVQDQWQSVHPRLRGLLEAGADLAL